MKTQSPLTEITEQAKQLIASINGLSAWNAKTPEEQTLDEILESAKNRIEGAVENVKVAFDFFTNNVPELIAINEKIEQEYKETRKQKSECECKDVPTEYLPIPCNSDGSVYKPKAGDKFHHTETNSDFEIKIIEKQKVSLKNTSNNNILIVNIKEFVKDIARNKFIRINISPNETTEH